MSDVFQNTLTLSDARRITGPLAFSVMIKPVGSLCNMDCSYCYYLDKSSIYGGKEPLMSDRMLETVVREYIEANDVSEVTFNWHGGEPLVAGLDFYRKAVGFERKYACGKMIHNTLQTNGTLLTVEWADFFRDNGFLIGISIDGPRDIHDRFRLDKGGFPTFDRVMRGINLLKDRRVEFNTLSAVSRVCEGRGLETYLFLKDIGSRYMQFMPVLEHVKYPLDGSGGPDYSKRPYIVDPSVPDAGIAQWSVSDMGFGKFLCDIFDYWVEHDVGSCFVGQFDATLASWCGVPPGICVFAETCGSNAVIEHNGDMYPCDHFVYSGRKLGNIAQKPLREMVLSSENIKFGIGKRNSLPRQCRECRVVRLCRGECPKHRFNTTDKGEPGLNALCRGYKMFYTHTADRMSEMKKLLLEGKSPAGVMNM